MFSFVLWGGLVLLFVCCFAVHDLSVVFLLSTHDNLLSGTMTATIVMMSAASVQAKLHMIECWHFCCDVFESSGTFFCQPRSLGIFCQRKVGVSPDFRLHSHAFYYVDTNALSVCGVWCLDRATDGYDAITRLRPRPSWHASSVQPKKKRWTKTCH